MPVLSWSTAERRQALAIGVAPLAVAFAVAEIVGLQAGTGSIFLFVALVPAAYATLFFFVLPALWLLRRIRKESPLSFAATCGFGTIAPWWLLYVVLFPEGSAKFGGAPLSVLALLAAPAAFAAVAGGVVYWLGTSSEVKNDA